MERAIDAPIIRKMFTSSPLDPRYHMLSYLSSKFSQPPEQSTNELRAALFLNRFTRTLTIIFATDSVAEILGVTAQQLVSKSFYYCIQEDCLRDAVRCLEGAKANNSIAYLRFWYRDPLQGEGSAGNEFEDHTVHPATQLNIPTTQYNPGSSDVRSERLGGNTTQSQSQAQSRPNQPGVEVEAVVSCTSDGLVVILRRARPMIPQQIHQTTQPGPSGAAPYGLFASPWATQPIFPQWNNPASSQHTQMMPGQSHLSYYQPPLPVNPQIYPGYSSAYNPTAPAAVPGSLSYGSTGPSRPYSEPSHLHSHDLLQTIREVAVFAWGVVGINGSLEQFKSGRPQGDALPPEGIQVWDALAALKQENVSDDADTQEKCEEDEELEKNKLESGDNQEGSRGMA